MATTEHALDKFNSLAAKVAAASDLESFKSAGAFDELLEQSDADKLEINGKNGFLGWMIKTLSERGLQAELSAELGYEKGDPEAGLTPNSRNGSYPIGRNEAVVNVDDALVHIVQIGAASLGVRYGP